MLGNKKLPALTESSEFKVDTIIIRDKAYNVNELNAIFSYKALMLINDKNELLKYWQMAIETEVKRFINTVDTVFCKKFPKYE